MKLHAKPYPTSFIVSWLGLGAIFWGLIALSLPYQRLAPPAMGMIRAGFAARGDLLWRYTGPRPAQGQVLRLFARLGVFYTPPADFQLTAYTGIGDRLDSDKPLVLTSPPDKNNLFTIFYVDLPEVPRGREIWMGVKFAPGLPLEIERGDPPPGTFAPRPLFRSTHANQPLERDPLSWIGPIGVRIVPAGSPAASPALPAWLLLAFAGAGLLLLPFAGRQWRWWIVALLLHWILLWKAFEALFPSQWWWGEYFLDRWGKLWFWTGLPLVQLLMFPPLAAKISRGWRPVTRRLNRAWRSWFFWPVALPATGLLTFLAYRFKSICMYGDGFGALARPGYVYHNPMATGLYHAWRWWLVHKVFKDGEKNVHIGYADIELVQIFTVMCAPLYFFGLAVLARQLGRCRREALMIFFGLLGLKTLFVQFGYVEVYGPASAVEVWVVVLILWGVRKGRVLPPTLYAFFAYLFHMSGAMALPAVMVLWARRFLRSRHRALWLAGHLALTIPLSLLIWAACLRIVFIYNHDRDLKLHNLVVPAPNVNPQAWPPGRMRDLVTRIGNMHGLPMLYGSTGVPADTVWLQWSTPNYRHFYVLPSWAHLSQFTGELIFTTGPVTFLMLLGMALGWRRWGRSAEGLALVLVALAFALASALLATSFPYPKDWDVVSVQVVWWAACCWWLLARGGVLSNRAVRWVMFALLLYLLWDTLPWMIYNNVWGPPVGARAFGFI